MKKLFLLILLIVFSPIIVYAADNCSSDQIAINSVEVKNTSGDIVENEPARIENGVLYTNLNFVSVGDSIEYHVNVENKSNEDYYFDENSIKTKTKYVDYEISYDDNNPIIKKKSSKDVDIQITYNREIDEDEYHSNDSMKINLVNDKKILSNPKTSTTMIVALLVLILLVISLLLFKGKRKELLILLIMFIPTGVFAICKVELDMKCNISIEKKYTGYSYLYNERGSGALGTELNIQKKSFWCSVFNENEEYYCALDPGFETEEECNAYVAQYYDPGTGSCVKRERLYDDSLIFHEINPIPFYRPYYIKLYIEKNIPKEVYVCFKTDKDYCMKAGDDSLYNDNVEILRSQQSLFGNCDFGNDYSYCRQGNSSLNYITINGGSINIGNGYGAQCSAYDTFACVD